jgi:hypothetical protein
MTVATLARSVGAHEGRCRHDLPLLWQALRVLRLRAGLPLRGLTSVPRPSGMLRA